MKYSMISASLLATFASAAPLARGTVNIVLETSAISDVAGEGDTATVISVPFGKLADGSAFQKAVNADVSGGNNVPISDAEITCQCFKDATGAILLGDSFTNIFPGTKLSDDQPVQIGSIFCSDAASVKAQIAKGQAASSPAKHSATARIQLDFSGEGAVQGEVPINGKAVPTKGLFASPVGTDALIISVTGIDASKVTCQAFADAKGKKTLGIPFNMDQEATFSTTDVPVGSFSCTAI